MVLAADGAPWHWEAFRLVSTWPGSNLPSVPILSTFSFFPSRTVRRLAPSYYDRLWDFGTLKPEAKWTEIIRIFVFLLGKGEIGKFGPKYVSWNLLFLAIMYLCIMSHSIPTKGFTFGVPVLILNRTIICHFPISSLRGIGVESFPLAAFVNSSWFPLLWMKSFQKIIVSNLRPAQLVKFYSQRSSQNLCSKKWIVIWHVSRHQLLLSGKIWIASR
jgi:hypothetical protein